MTRILVTGASGLLGLNFALQHAAQHQITGVVNSQALRRDAPFAVRSLDLSQPGSGAALLKAERPEILVHCAAVANLEVAEKNPALAQRVNADLPGELAEASRRLGVRMVHLSTDAVFDGAHGPYMESDQPHPLSAYARSKWAGEQAVAAANSQAIIARVNFYGWSLNGRRSLAEFFYNQLSGGQPANGWTDVFFCPLEVNMLGDLLLEMAQQGLEGLYHVVSSECLSKYDFGRAVARAFGFDEGLVKPTRVADSGLHAARSPDLRLSTMKLARDLGRALPGQAECLARFQREYAEGYAGRLRGLAA
ncbi:dTDP-4-dehydrorhamnose reductase [Longilinea arvoryzae]|uniref:dTDP-4-dehydrorhamnose reductase n=1 Tax=Longilinea arvoryzae TaxID=360412 RepID=A0A0S7B8E3_9CHLR|nr:SDR family oxidoreductase [Longilinea arvoryzae]GAP13775.1 dTDP-4-dehydrorhamnose reductase [Longilinea arvoryzae]